MAFGNGTYSLNTDGVQGGDDWFAQNAPTSSAGPAGSRPAFNPDGTRNFDVPIPNDTPGWNGTDPYTPLNQATGGNSGGNGGDFEQAFADITRGFTPGDIQNSGQIQQLLSGLEARGLHGYRMGGTDAQGRTDSIVGPDGSVYRVFDSKGQWTPMKDQGGSAWGGGGGGFGSLTFDGSGGTFNAPSPFTMPTLEEARNSPGYQFALEQGLKGIQNSAAAKGTLLTGGTLKALQGYGTGLADQTYGNLFNRALGVNQNNFGQALAANQTNFGQGLQKHQTQYGDLYNLAALGKPS